MYDVWFEMKRLKQESLFVKELWEISRIKSDLHVEKPSRTQYNLMKNKNELS